MMSDISAASGHTSEDEGDDAQLFVVTSYSDFDKLGENPQRSLASLSTLKVSTVN